MRQPTTPFGGHELLLAELPVHPRRFWTLRHSLVRPHRRKAESKNVSRCVDEEDEELGHSLQLGSIASGFEPPACHRGPSAKLPITSHYCAGHNIYERSRSASFCCKSASCALRVSRTACIEKDAGNPPRCCCNGGFTSVSASLRWLKA